MENLGKICMLVFQLLDKLFDIHIFPYKNVNVSILFLHFLMVLYWRVPYLAPSYKLGVFVRAL